MSTLKTNLLSIWHLCYKYHSVVFTSEGCHVFDKQNKCIMIDRRSLNNCYLLGDCEVVFITRRDTMVALSSMETFNMSPAEDAFNKMMKDEDINASEDGQEDVRTDSSTTL